jgi:hypothetical protein
MGGGRNRKGVKEGRAYPVKGMGDLGTEEVIDADKRVVWGLRKF